MVFKVNGWHRQCDYLKVTMNYEILAEQSKIFRCFIDLFLEKL